MNRKYACLALAGLLFSGFASLAAQAAAYPDKPVHIVVPAPPGGGTDFLARWIGVRWAEKTGQSVIVDNVSGANGNVGSTKVARAAPDGYTLMMSFVGTQSINPVLYTKLTYIPQDDVTAVVKVASYPFVIAVNADSPIRSLGALVERAKKGNLSFASAGIGSGGHLTGEMFNQLNNVRLGHIPYRGSAPAAADVAAGQVDVLFDTLATASPLMKGGKLRVLAVTSEKRLAQFPDIPTVVELGMPRMVNTGWYGLFAPKATPRAILDSVAADVSVIMGSQAYEDAVAAIGYIPERRNTPAAFQGFVKAESSRWGSFIRQAGITAD
jgi:tripartite-type tricarboxylate transporter receptor subunit TctC